MLSVRNLEVVYNDVVHVLKGVSLDVPEGSIVALLGGNGTGKSTLLSIVSGELPADAGTVWRAPGTRVARLVQDVPLERACAAVAATSEDVYGPW